MYGLGIRGWAARIVESGALHHRAEIIQRCAARFGVLGAMVAVIALFAGLVDDPSQDRLVGFALAVLVGAGVYYLISWNSIQNLSARIATIENAVNNLARNGLGLAANETLLSWESSRRNR